MKAWMLSLLITGSAWAQTDPVESVHIARNSTPFPHVGKYYDGEIPVSALLDTNGIESGDNYRIISFSINYPNGQGSEIRRIYGRKIPEDVIVEIYRSSLGEMIIFTDIMAMDPTGNIVYLMPMHLIPVQLEK